MLRYTAELKLDLSTPAADKAAAVESVVSTLALEQCRGVVIGSDLQRGISGGQAKRVNIGIALISGPQILFMDEPTTGLDSFTANEVMDVVKKLAAGGITVAATIHSPTAYTFNLFDRLMILLRGKVVYFGRQGPQAIEYLRAATSTLATTVEYDATSGAEWITDVTVVADRSGAGELLAQTYAASTLKTHADEELTVQLAATAELPAATAKALAVRRETTTPTWYALLVLLRYRMLKNYQTVAFYASRSAPWIFQTLIIFSVFWAVALDLSQATVNNVVAIIFFWSTTPAFGAAAYIPSIMLARPLYFRERNDGLYRPITFLMYLMIEEILVAVPVSLVVCTIMWFGLRLAGSWFMWWVSFAITYIAGVAVSYAISSVSPNMDVANAAVPVFGVCCLFFSGVLIRVQDVGWWWRWILYATPTYWAVCAQIRNFFSGDRDIPYLGYPSVTAYYDVEYMSAWEFVAMQTIFPVVFLIMTWAALAYKRTVKR